MTTIPLVDLGSQQAEIADEVRAGLDEVFAATAFVGGPAVGRFETAYAAFVGRCSTASVSPTAPTRSSSRCAPRASGPGGEVIIPANTFIATAEAVSRIGAVPVPVDVDPVHLLIDPDAVRAAVGPRTEAIVPVHLFGQVAPVEEIGKIAADAGVPMIEDAAQSQGALRHGRAAGSFGLAAGTSFYPGKNLGAAGDAGAVTTSDAEVARTVRVLSAHGRRASTSTRRSG